MRWISTTKRFQQFLHITCELSKNAQKVPNYDGHNCTSSPQARKCQEFFFSFLFFSFKVFRVAFVTMVVSGSFVRLAERLWRFSLPRTIPQYRMLSALRRKVINILNDVFQHFLLVIGNSRCFYKRDLVRLLLPNVTVEKII